MWFVMCDIVTETIVLQPGVAEAGSWYAEEED